MNNNMDEFLLLYKNTKDQEHKNYYNYPDLRVSFSFGWKFDCPHL
jgi:hypothetical protein